MFRMSSLGSGLILSGSGYSLPPSGFGYLTSSQLEAHNKIMKFNRDRHTMKRDRKEQMEQWIDRSVVLSDPIVLHESQPRRLKYRPFREYPQVIQDMVDKDHPFNKVWREQGQF